VSNRGYLAGRAARRCSAVLAAVSSLALCAGAAHAAEDVAETGKTTTTDQAATQALMAKLQSMERRIRGLQAELKDAKAQEMRALEMRARALNGPGMAQVTPSPASSADKPDTQPLGDTKQQSNARLFKAADLKATPIPPPNKGLFGAVESPIAGLSIGAYGELKFGAMQNPAAGGQWQNGFDANRIVLLPTYQISDNIIFNAEIEWEHGGIAFDNDDKLHGTSEIEQAYIDFKFTDYFNWRAPGVDLIPISYNNLFHEPTLFYSVNRPELANGLIPTTWYAPSTSVYGRLADGLTYQIQVSQAIEDFGDAFDARTDANTVPPFPGPYAAGINGMDAFGLAKAPIGDFRQLSNSLAYTLRLAYTPWFLPGFAGSTAVYFAPNITPRGAYSDTGVLLGSNSLTIFDTEFRYRVPDTGFEFRGEFVYATFSNPENLRANNDTDPTNNVGKSMYGVSGEIAYHFRLGQLFNTATEWEAVPFYRYTYENLQTGGFAGTDADLPTGAGQLQFHTFGIAIFPTPKVVLKATYQKVISNDPMGANSDSFLGAVGFFF
jgi:hypothetical protein